MSKKNSNWLHDLFINEAKAAKNYHNRGGGEEIPTQEKTVDITENGTVIVEPDEGHTMSKVTANVSVQSEDSPLPIEVTTATEMNTLLETAEVGAVYKYTGETTGTYKNGVLYLVKENK